MTGPIVNNPLIPNYNTNPLQGSGDVGGPGAGSGVNGVNGQTPEPPSEAAYNMILGSLAVLTPNLSSEDRSVLLMEIITALKETQQKSEQDQYKVDAETKRAELAEKKQKLDESAEKLIKAEEERKNASIWDKIKLFFQAIGAALMIALGAIIAPVAPVAGALMIAAGVVMMINTIDAVVRAATGLGIAGNIAKLEGATSEEIAKIERDFMISMAVIGVVLSVASIVAGNVGGAAQAIKDALSTGQMVANIIGQATTAVTAAGDIAAGGVRYHAATLEAESKNLKADAKDTEAFIKMLDDAIDQALARLMAAGDRFNEMLDDLVGAVTDLGNTLARAKLSA